MLQKIQTSNQIKKAIILDDQIEINHYQNILIKNFSSRNYNSSITIEKNLFIVYSYESSYYHTILDNLGQFLYLRNFLNNDLYFCIISEHRPQDNYQTNKLLKQILLELEDRKVPHMMLFINEYDEINLDNVFNITHHNTTMLHHILSKTIYSKEELSMEIKKQLVEKFAESSRDFFSKYLSHTQTKKIFLSRGKYSDTLRDKVDKIQRIEKDGIIKIFKNEIKIIDSFAYNKLSQELKDTISAYFVEFSCRYISKIEEDRLENFFKSAGYEIVDAQSIDFLDQIRLWSSASHFATIAGAGTVNCIFLNADTNVFIINHDMGYRFHHYAHIDHFIKNPIYLFDYRDYEIGKDSSFSIDEITNVINKNFLNIL